MSKLLTIEVFDDVRGRLVVVESEKSIPFPIKRAYFITNVKDSERRGYHAHRNLNQIAICIKGECSFLLDDGISTETVRLSSPDIGLRIGSMVWREMFDFSDDCVLAVFADQYYDEYDYIKDYSEFKLLVKSRIC